MDLTFSKETKKLMVKAIEEVTGEKAKYLGVPSCAYQIGDYRVEKDGTLKWEDNQDADPDQQWLLRSASDAHDLFHR